MPELPEVETIRRQLEKEIVGEKIVDVWCDRAKVLRPSPNEFTRGVVGKTIAKIKRRAKLLIIELTESSSVRSRSYAVSHLRLSGRILIRRKSDEADDYVHAILKFNGEKELRFAEARLFGYMEYLPNQKALNKKLAGFGPEVFDLRRERFPGILAATRKAIKPLLMDQKRIAGIGNIYANDALYLAKINPETPANQISPQKADKLYAALRKVLEESLRDGGASDQWYRQIHGEKGSYQKHFKVYGRMGKKCEQCGGTIERIVVGGRGTFICPTCQRK
jgi:formamidopyrimidine-DNA glycosylase